MDVEALRAVARRKGSGKTLTFGVPHVLKAVEMMHRQKYVSRAAFCDGLQMGEGAVKTLVGHLRESGMADSVRAGTFLTEKGSGVAADMAGAMPAEAPLEPSPEDGAGHAVLVRGRAGSIRSGIEQRDMAVVCGASAALTLVYRDGVFSFPGERRDALEGRPGVLAALAAKPREGDVLIVAFAADPATAEMSAKNAALHTAAT